MAPFRKGVGPKINRIAIAKVNFEDREQGRDYWKLYKEGDEFIVLKAAANPLYYWARPNCDGADEIYPAMIRQDALDWKVYPATPGRAADKRRADQEPTADVFVSKVSKAQAQPKDARVADATMVMTRILGTEDVCDMLGVPRDAGVEALKKAYRQVTLLVHPDKCELEGAQKAFQKVSSAFRIRVPKNA